jgi:NADH dehydrogenase/NADH:ubiquinone oxidoreductase subunit G
MSQTLHAGENRIDRPSQIILGALNTDEWTFGEPLRDVAELGQNQQVFYRMDNHLLPAGLVEERAREDRPSGYEQARQFRLTECGADWVDDHAGEIARPATREETQQMAAEARDDAASAKASVQNYRKKLSRMKGHVEDLGDDLAEMDAQHAHDYERVAEVEQRVKQAERQSIQNESAIEKARNEVDTRATSEEVEQLREDLTTLDKNAAQRREEIESTLDEAVQRQAEAQQSRSFLRELATTVGMIAVVVYLVVLVAVGIFAPGLLVSVLIGGVGGFLGIGIGTAVSASALR